MPERSVVTTPAVSTASGSSSTWTFTQGFILGQASFLLIVLVFVRYVVFQAAEELDEAGHKKRRLEKANRTKLSTTSVPAPPASHVLGKTSYEMATHPAESSDWLNVLIAQVLQGYRNDLLSDGGEEGARQRIEQWLNPDGGSMSWLDPIQVTGLSLGSAYPLLSNARIRPADGKGHIRAEIDIDYMDSLSLSLSTSVLINFPRPRFAVLPVALGVELVSIGGTLSLEIHDPHGERQHLHACLLPDFHLNLKTTTLLGSRAKLQDIPKLEQLILSRFRAALQDRLVHPHHLTLALPRLMSASTSPTPLINDIGEGAVHAMNDALRKGVSQMVEDVIGAPNDDETHDIDSRWTSVAPSLQGSTADLRQKEINDAQRPKDSIRSIKRIPMPAGFPGYPTISAENSVPSTPATEDKYARPAPISTLNSYNTPRPTASTRNSTQRIPPYGTSSQYASSAAAAAPSVSQDSGHFRFRGQFASQPPTPGVDAPRREGRSGALNAR